jgi:predicted nucleic acid-binding protein
VSTVICDASVVVKLLVPEENSDRANLLAQTCKLVAPEIIFAEVGNVLWTRVRSGEFDLEAGQILFERLNSFDLESRPVHPLVARALAIAVELNHPIYDCLYLALAERLAAPFVTDDARFVAAIQRGKLFTAEVKVLSQTI